MKRLFILIAIPFTFYACSGNKQAKEEPAATSGADLMKEDKLSDDERGIGKFTNVEIADKLDLPMTKEGNAIYDLKCSSCHRLTDEKLVGPGWKGVTKRRKPEWIMNFSTNTEEMLDKDAVAQAMLEICMVRMPNQSLSDDDARKVYEFMRKNDGVK